MLSISKPRNVPLPPQEIAKLHDYKKKWLEAMRVSTVRSDTTRHKFSTLPIGLNESEPPPNVDFNFLSFFRGRDALGYKEKVIFYKGFVLLRTEEEEMLIVTNEDVRDGIREVSAEVFTQDKEDFLPTGTETVNLECYTTTSIPEVSMAERESFADGIRLSEKQFEELNYTKHRRKRWR